MSRDNPTFQSVAFAYDIRVERNQVSLEGMQDRVQQPSRIVCQAVLRGLLSEE